MESGAIFAVLLQFIRHDIAQKAEHELEQPSLLHEVMQVPLHEFRQLLAPVDMAESICSGTKTIPRIGNSFSPFRKKLRRVIIF